VVGIRKYANGDIEIDFYHDDELTEYRYSANPKKPGTFPKELAETLVSTLASDICVEIYFDKDGNLTYLELEECDYDEANDE
jgi:hypothetical protein